MQYLRQPLTNGITIPALHFLRVINFNIGSVKPRFRLRPGFVETQTRGLCGGVWDDEG